MRRLPRFCETTSPALSSAVSTNSTPTDRPLLLAPYIEVIATKLNQVRNGAVKRLIINLPPRTLKSHCVSIAFVAWMLGLAPSKQILCVSYGQDLADERAAACLRLMQSDFYRKLFGAVLTGRHPTNDIRTRHEGRRLSVSVGGAIAGRGADIIIVDDPHKADELTSEYNRRSTLQWYDQALLGRLNSRSDGAIIIVMQRLHEDDLVGHVRKQEDWDVLSLPAIAERDERHLIEGVLWRRLYTRKRGEALNPDWESVDTLRGFRKAISPATFESQYQQNPYWESQRRAAEREHSERFSRAYQSGDRLTLGRLWRQKITEDYASEITDEQAMISYLEFVKTREDVLKKI